MKIEYKKNKILLLNRDYLIFMFQLKRIEYELEVGKFYFINKLFK